MAIETKNVEITVPWYFKQCLTCTAAERFAQQKLKENKDDLHDADATKGTLKIHCQVNLDFSRKQGGEADPVPEAGQQNPISMWAEILYGPPGHESSRTIYTPSKDVKCPEVTAATK